MSRSGALRADEEWLKEYTARRTRWQAFTPTSGFVDSLGKPMSGPELPAPDADPPVAQRIATGPLTPRKYRNKPTDGFASGREAKRAAELKLREAAGEIRRLRFQVPYLLIPKQAGERSCSFIADFTYEERTSPGENAWLEVVEDSKGLRTDVYIVKRKLMLFLHRIIIRET